MAEQEVYYVIAGEIELEWEDGALTAGADTAVYLAPGYTYVLRGASESAMVVYVYVPAPV
jgi:hypothetical protein